MRVRFYEYRPNPRPDLDLTYNLEAVPDRGEVITFAEDPSGHELIVLDRLWAIGDRGLADVLVIVGVHTYPPSWP